MAASGSRQGGLRQAERVSGNRQEAGGEGAHQEGGERGLTQVSGTGEASNQVAPGGGSSQEDFGGGSSQAGSGGESSPHTFGFRKSVGREGAGDGRVSSQAVHAVGSSRAGNDAVSSNVVRVGGPSQPGNGSVSSHVVRVGGSSQGVRGRGSSQGAPGRGSSRSDVGRGSSRAGGWVVSQQTSCVGGARETVGGGVARQADAGASRQTAGGLGAGSHRANMQGAGHSVGRGSDRNQTSAGVETRAVSSSDEDETTNGFSTFSAFDRALYPRGRVPVRRCRRGSGGRVNEDRSTQGQGSREGQISVAPAGGQGQASDSWRVASRNRWQTFDVQNADENIASDGSSNPDEMVRENTPEHEELPLQPIEKNKTRPGD